MLNSEWYRSKPSKLELSLRVPYLIKECIKLFFTRTLLIIVLFFLIFYLFISRLFISLMFSFFATLVFELFTVRNWLLNKVIPQHQENLIKIKKSYKKRASYSIHLLIKEIGDKVKLNAWSIIRFVYGIIPSQGWEVIFKILYPIFTSSNISYQNFLIGLSNKSIESDQKLWEIAQKDSEKKQEKLLKKYLDEYGSKGDDFDLAKPTLREHSKAINKLIEIYKNTTSPYTRLEKAKQKRLKAKKKVLKDLRVPRIIFERILEIVQKNVVLREDRRFYEFESEFYIRGLILELAKKMKLKEDQIFKMSWKEIKNAAN